MNNVLSYFAMKYKGNFKKMFITLHTKESVDRQKLKEHKKVKYKYVALIDDKYPNYFQTIKCPPIVLFCKGILNL